MFDVAMLGVLTEATMPVLTKLHATVQVELEQQKKVGQAGGVSQDLQAILQGARQPLEALLEFMFGERGGQLDAIEHVDPALATDSHPKCTTRRHSLASDRRCYRLLSSFPSHRTPQGYQPATIGSIVELGNWDPTKTMPLTPVKANPPFYSTDLLLVPNSSARVEFRWIFIGEDGAEMITELVAGSDTECPSKFVDIEPDLWGLPKEFDCCLLCPEWGVSGGNLGKYAAPPEGSPMIPTAQFKSTELRKPGGSTILVFGSSVSAGFGSQAPWVQCYRYSHWVGPRAGSRPPRRLWP